MERFEVNKALAIKLNEARLLANESPDTAICFQSGVYGMIANALIEVLAHLVGQSNANQAYDALVDGATIDDIL
jgi:hypothetical protein